MALGAASPVSQALSSPSLTAGTYSWSTGVSSATACQGRAPPTSATSRETTKTRRAKTRVDVPARTAILSDNVDALTILVSIVGLSVMVIVHETGHYLAARAFGMRVLRYSIGFGPTLFKWQPKGSDTVFQVGAVPFLAYVQIAGMNPYEENDPDDEGLFNKKSVFGRIVTIAAGPIANYILAVLIFFGLLVSYNMPDQSLSVPPQAGSVMEPSPAHESGLLPGDVFISVAGQPVATFPEVVEATQSRGGVATEYVVERAGERRTLIITPRLEGEVARIGVASAVSEGLRGAAAGAAFEEALLIPWERTKGTILGMAAMFRERTTEGVGGPVAIATMLAEAADKGWQPFVALIGLISIALGVFNLLPFPALDGGRLVFLGFEVITRRKPNERFETAVHVVGILFLLSVMVLVTYRDIFGG